MMEPMCKLCATGLKECDCIDAKKPAKDLTFGDIFTSSPGWFDDDYEPSN